MPRRDDLKTILVLGSGPIKIGQAAEFDFSGSQAVRALREDGYEVILVNSNPATIQNDPDSILSYAIDDCTSNAADFIFQDEVFDHFLDITNDGQQWLTIPFVDYESQKYYSQFYV